MTQIPDIQELLSNVNEYKVYSRLKEKLQKLTEANNTEGVYDLSSLEAEVREARDNLYNAIENAQQFSGKYDSSTLNKYTIITHYDYDDSNSIDLFVYDGIIENDFCNIRHILTDKVLKEGTSDESSIDKLCGDWIDYHLYLYYVTWFKA